MTEKQKKTINSFDHNRADFYVFGIIDSNGKKIWDVSGFFKRKDAIQFREQETGLTWQQLQDCGEIIASIPMMYIRPNLTKKSL